MLDRYGHLYGSGVDAVGTAVDALAFTLVKS
jgi:hypothetical protein